MTGDFLIIEGVVDGCHMRRTIIEVAVVVVSSQEIHVATGSCATTIGRTAGKPGAGIAPANIGQTGNDFGRGVIVIIVGSFL